MGKFELVGGGSINRDAGAGEGDGVAGAGGVGVADFAPEFTVIVAREFCAAGAFFGPGVVGSRSAGRARGVGAPAADGVVLDCRRRGL